MEPDRHETLAALRSRIGGTHPAHAGRRPIRFGLPSIDDRLAGGGLRTGALHEMLGQGPDIEHGTLPSLLAAALLARHDPHRPVFWAMRRPDLFPPGLAAAGLHPRRLILADAGDAVLAVMEEALRHSGLLAVVGEVDGPLGLTASRRLQLAAERSGVTAFAIRRSRRFDDPALRAPGAALTRWQVGCLPSCSPSGLLPDRATWRLDLLRARDCSPFHSIVQACDAQGRFDEARSDSARFGDAPDRHPLAAVVADRPAAARAG